MEIASEGNELFLVQNVAIAFDEVFQVLRRPAGAGNRQKRGEGRSGADHQSVVREDPQGQQSQTGAGSEEQSRANLVAAQGTSLTEEPEAAPRRGRRDRESDTDQNLPDDEGAQKETGAEGQEQGGIAHPVR